MNSPSSAKTVDPTIGRLLFHTAWILAVTGFGLAAALAMNLPLLSLRVQLHVGIGLVGVAVLFLTRAGKLHVAGSLLIWGYWIDASVVTSINGGLRGPNLINYPLILVIAGWILGTRQTVALAILTEVFFIGLLVGDAYEVVPPADYVNSHAYLVFLTGIVLATATATLLSRRGYAMRVDEAQRVATDLAAREEELRQNRDNLEREVAQRTAELESARAEAVRLMKVKSDFLANMSHEIRTPLNGVLGLAQIGMRKTSDPVAHGSFARILDAGKLLQGVIDDILDLSKIEAGKLRIESVPVDVKHLMDRSVGLLRERAEAKGLRLRQETAAQVPAAFLGDPLRVAQALMNLLSNAVKFTERGEVSLRVSLEGEHLSFCVSDTGIGIAPDRLASIFDAFEQAEANTTRHFGGTGLGLAITQRLAQLMGGALDVESDPGVGSCFILRLPCRPVELPRETEPVAGTGNASHRLAGCRVLAVDDFEMNRMILAEVLETEGALVTLAEDGQESIEAVRQAMAAGTPFDIVLMDIQMPVMDGLTAAPQIRALMPGLPIVGQSANAMDEDRRLSESAGMVDHLAKPIDIELLVAVVRRHVPSARFAPAG